MGQEYNSWGRWMRDVVTHGSLGVGLMTQCGCGLL